MVKKVKKGQLLWTVTSEDEVVHGHVKEYGKDWEGRREISLLLGDGSLDVSNEDNYTIIHASPSFFYYTRQEAINSLIKEVKADLQRRQEFLELLCSEKKKNGTKDIIFSQYTSPGKFEHFNGVSVEMN